MFERYTEKARRVIFFACYEASQLGSPYIETEHLLLGHLLREDKALTNRVDHSYVTETIPKPSHLANVAITSMPVGSDIQVDDAFLGYTPAQVSLEVGERVTITKRVTNPGNVD